MSIAESIIGLRKELPQAVRLVAVSKFKPASDIMEAYAAGQRAFGENRPQELAAKAAALPSDIEWHFIGHLQTNKVKMVLPYAALIHSVDSEHLLAEIDKAAGQLGKRMDCLLEVHIASEQSKQGFSAEEAAELIERKADYRNVRIRGLMGMATFTEDRNQVREEFRKLKRLYDRIATSDFDTLSMGMSQDYRIALEEGTTLVRIGTAIFGSR